MAHLIAGAKGFLFSSTSSVYNPPGGAPKPQKRDSFGIHTHAAYAFTKVANEATNQLSVAKSEHTRDDYPGG